MPLYSFRNTKTNEEFTLHISYDDKVKFLEENPDVQSIITRAPSLGDAVRLGIVKPDEGFRDRLREIKSSHHGSNINIR